MNYNFVVQDYHTYYIGSEGILVHNTCVEVQKVFKESGVDNFDDLASKFTPDKMISWKRYEYILYCKPLC